MDTLKNLIKFTQQAAERLEDTLPELSQSLFDEANNAKEVKHKKRQEDWAMFLRGMLRAADAARRDVEGS